VARREDLDVPAAVRAECYERDAGHCRVCGRHVEQPALHHIVYRSHGGLHIPSNLVTIGWLFDHDCHLKLAHGPESGLYRSLLQSVVDRPGITALQVKRWNRL
jgi:5-methylcytosine-specific restriction endonuclease McrA